VAQPDPYTAAPRERLRASLPAGYSWPRHVALVGAFVAGGVALAWSQLGALTSREWAALAVMLLAINLGEYVSHRWRMHVRRFPIAVYHRHVAEHHAFFTHDRMGMDAWRDLAWVLFPPWALPLLMASIAPWLALVWLAGGRTLAWLLFLATVAYYGVYEVTHALTHLPDRHPLARSRMARAFTRHHRVHHDPALMRHWNFNFAIPLFDVVFRTRRGPH